MGYPPCRRAKYGSTPSLGCFLISISYQETIEIRSPIGYAGNMNVLPELLPGQLALMVVDRPASLLLPALIARLALRTRLRVIDAGNCFAAFAIARELRRATPDLEAALKRIQVRRAFTCYQALAMLEDTPAETFPVVILDLLCTFYDENVRLVERQRLLMRCTQALQRIGRQAPVGVVVYQRPERPETPLLLKTLERAAGQVWRFETERPTPPARLF